MTQSIQPKRFLPKFATRRRATGQERVGNIRKYILEKNTYFPKPIEYSDIDQEMYNWVDKTFDLVYNGKRLPTYKLYSTQRLSEYSQTWTNVDDSGSLVLNFKSLTREPNAQKGESQGGIMNIPGHRSHTMYLVPVLQENGDEAFDLYTMKAPFQVNFTYSVAVVTSKYELLNEMNSKMHYEFQSINSYICVNGHYMPLTLEDVNDESSYEIEDRKYYSQTFKIKLKAYIIRKEDFTIQRVPSKIALQMHEDLTHGKIDIRKGKNPPKSYQIETLPWKYEKSVSENGLKHEDTSILGTSSNNTIEIIEETCPEECIVQKEKQRFFNKRLKVLLNFNECDSAITFTIDTDMVIESVHSENVFDYRLIVNQEVQSNKGQTIYIYDEDEITVKVTKKDNFKDTALTLIGYDPNNVYDIEYNPESALDEEIMETEIIVENNKEDNTENVNS